MTCAAPCVADVCLREDESVVGKHGRKALAADEPIPRVKVKEELPRLPPPDKVYASAARQKDLLEKALAKMVLSYTKKTEILRRNSSLAAAKSAPDQEYEMRGHADAEVAEEVSENEAPAPDVRVVGDDDITVQAKVRASQYCNKDSVAGHADEGQY